MSHFAGNWTEALRRVVESVYSFFSYDVTTYIAGNLEIDEGGQEEGDDEQGQQGQEETVKTEEEEEGGGGERGSSEQRELAKEGGEVEGRGEAVEEEREEDEEDEETDDAMSGLEYDTSTEEDAFEESKSPECSKETANSTPRQTDTDSGGKSNNFHTNHTSSSPTTNHRASSNSSSGSSHKTVVSSPSHPISESSGAHGGAGSNNNKTISSFTVENILMGNTSRSNSTSSGSPTSATHSSNATFLAFPPTTQVGPPVTHASSTPGSPASANWTSHPPVKYTKFTMMSPSSMRIGGDKRRKGERDKTVTTTSDVHTLQTPSSAVIEEVAHQVSRCKEEPKSPAPPSTSAHLSTAASSVVSSHVPHLTYHHSVIQTAIPSSTTAASLSRQSSSQSVTGAPVAAAASPRLVPVSPNPFSRVATQSPHQQYVVFFPQNVALMTAPTGDLQVIGQNSAQLYIQSATTAATTAFQQANGNHSHKKISSPHPSSSSPSPPPNPNTGSVLSSSNNLRLFRTSSNPSFGTSHKLSDPSHFHSRTSTATTSTLDKSQAAMMRKLGAKSLLPAGGGEKGDGGGKGMPKQKKLRFHMTTVVKKVRRRSSSVSLTAPPPTLCNRPPPQPDTRRKDQEPVGAVHTDSSQHNRVESGPKPTTTTAQSISQGTELSNHTNAESTSSNNPTSSTTSSSNETGPRPPHSSSVSQTTGYSSSQTQHSSDSSKQIDMTKFDNHLPPLSQSSSAPTVESFTGHLPSEQINSNRGGRGRGRGRRSRGYTRRKRELTFHLYEDPYRAKRTRQQN